MDFTVQLFIFSSYRTHITASSIVNIASLIRPRSDHSIAFALVKVTLRHWILWQLSDITLTCEDGRVAADSLWGCRLYCCCWNKTKSMLLVREKNKSHVVDDGTKQKPGWFKLQKTVSFIQQFVEAHSQSYLKEVIWFWSSLIDFKYLIKFKYSLPLFRCTFGNYFFCISRPPFEIEGVRNRGGQMGCAARSADN